MDQRIKNITRLLSDYASGNFDHTLPVSKKMDTVDAITSAINMLGEELKDITISRNYFNDIFHTVSDMLFILDREELILDCNKAVCVHTGYNCSRLRKSSINVFSVSGKPVIPESYMEQLLRNGKKKEWKTDWRKKDDGHLPVQLSLGRLSGTPGNKQTVLLMAKDITMQIQKENAVIRAIVETQEQERRRLASDLHDGLGQRLSAVKFYIGTIAAQSSNEAQKAKLVKSNKALLEMIEEMRNICFSLLPPTLADFGLLQTVRELCRQPEYEGRVVFKIKADPGFPQFPEGVSLDIFRVIQEFITNALVHGKAGKIWLHFITGDTWAEVVLRDDGEGFEVGKISGSGRGIRNARSRIQSHSGRLAIYSMPGKGTIYKLQIPLGV